MEMHPELSKKLVMAQLNEALVDQGLFTDAVQLEEIGHPLFFIRFVNKAGVTRLLRFDATNYDYQAVAVEPVDPVTREALAQSNWMLKNGGQFPSHHMKGGGPFLCFQGTRDYYTHESHQPSVTGERWEKLRSDFKIPDLIRYIKSKFASGEWE
jgi:hypothetical protein